MITDENFASQVDDEVVFYYATFRWMIRLSVLSIISGLAALLLGGVCVLFSLRSPTAQYMSLLAGWNDENRLQITYDRDEVGSEWIYLANFGAQRPAVLDAALKYQARFATAAQYQQHRQKS